MAKAAARMVADDPTIKGRLLFLGSVNTMQKTAMQVYRELKQIDWSLVDLKMKKIDLKGNSIADVKDEALKFLALCAVSEKTLAPGVLPDEYWHQMILDTPSYSQTIKIFGRFIHHVQNDGTTVARERDRECFWNTIQVYEDTFGEPHLKVWGLEKISASKND